MPPGREHNARNGDYATRDMRPEDIPAVMEIDGVSFPNPWPENVYLFELRENHAAHLLVLAHRDSGTIVGFVGYWLVVDEAHISTFAIHPEYRKRGLGGVLLAGMLRDAVARGAVSALLEVRAGNRDAQALYARFAFNNVGRRHGYYRDNGEDALLMTALIPDVIPILEREAQ
jgi:ribosomal-protein-alanine N-acetyltransferase